MILVDTSVWVDYLNGKASWYTDRLDQGIIESNVLMGDLILLEILQGIRNDQQFSRVKSNLLLLDQVNLLSIEVATVAATNYRRLRKKGITIRKTNDVIIATFCMMTDTPLLYQDRGFQPFASHLGLKTIENN